MQVEKNSINSNSFFVKIGWLGASSIIKYMLQFATIILYSNWLTKEEYGNYQYVWLLVNMFCVIIPFGLNSLLLSANLNTLFNFYKANRKVICSCLILLLLSFIVLLFGFVKAFSSLEKIYILVFAALQVIIIIQESILIRTENLKAYFWINTIYFSFFLAWHYIVGIHNYGIGLLLKGLIVMTVCKLILQAIFTNNIKNEKSGNDNIKAEWIYLGTYEVLSIIVKWVDKWIILLLLPTTSFAIYFNGTYEIPIFLLLLGAIGNVSLVEISKLDLTETDKIFAIFKKPILFLAAIIFPCLFFLLLNSSTLFQLFFDNKYNESIPIFMITLLLMPARIAYSTSVLQVFGKSKIIVNGVVIDLIVALILMALLYPLLHFKGFALAFVISTYIQILYYLVHTKKLLNKKLIELVPFGKIFLIAIITFLIAVIANEFAQLQNNYIRIAIGIFTCVANILIAYFFIAKPKNINFKHG